MLIDDYMVNESTRVKLSETPRVLPTADHLLRCGAGAVFSYYTWDDRVNTYTLQLARLAMDGTVMLNDTRAPNLNPWHFFPSDTHVTPEHLQHLVANNDAGYNTVKYIGWMPISTTIHHATNTSTLRTVWRILRGKPDCPVI